MDNLAMALGALAGLVQLAGYWQYNKLMSRSDQKPNVASWFMWAVGGSTEFVVYDALVKDGAKEILPIICALVAIITFVRVWWRAGSLRLTKQDWIIVGFDGVVIAFWFVTRNPFASNALLGIDMFLSFWPILVSTWKNPKSEDPKPWRTWSVAYGLLTVVVILKWQNGWELIYPVLYLVLHMAVWLLTSTKSAHTAEVS